MRSVTTRDGEPVAFCEADDLETQRDEACRWAEEWLHWRAACTEKPAVVFDIDATLVHEQATIPSVLRLYETAKALGAARFIITARSDDGRTYTRNELRRHGIEEPRHLFMHPRHAPCSSSAEAGQAKEAARRRIEKRGYSVILNVGDAFHDHYASGHRELHRVIGNRRCAVFVDQDDGCAHLKLGHPRHGVAAAVAAVAAVAG